MRSSEREGTAAAIHQATFYDVFDGATGASVVVVRGTIDALDMLQARPAPPEGGERPRRKVERRTCSCLCIVCWYACVLANAIGCLSVVGGRVFMSYVRGWVGCLCLGIFAGLCGEGSA